MNDLNVQQVILLTLLVSFVTSIATGITTVSLLERAPEPVTQTINRIVEKTIERVVPPEEDGVTTTKTPEKEIVTVVVNDEDLTVDAVSKNSRSLARIYSVYRNQSTFVALGLVVKENGMVATDATKIQSGNKYKIVYHDGELEADINFREANAPYALLAPKNVPAEKKFSPASLADSQKLKLAQTVISLSGMNTNVVDTGIVKGLYTDAGALPTSATSTPSQGFKLIETDIDPNTILAGTIIVNLQGEIVGIRIGSHLVDLNDFTPINSLKGFMAGR